jgi:hypothetical protein
MACSAMGTLVLGLFCACNSPTLPTPPPLETLNIPDAELAADGANVDLGGYAHPGATVIVVNRTLLESDPEEASAVTVAALDTGRYHARIRVDLRCVPTNVIDVTQRDEYGNYSTPRTFDAPNGFEDGAVPPGGLCTDAGVGDARPGDATEGGEGSTENGSEAGPSSTSGDASSD